MTRLQPLFFALLAVVVSSCKGPTPAPISNPASAPSGEATLHGHRGARGLQPENTLPAFERALDLEVDVLELDLHLSADGVVVVWHDPFIRATKCRAGGAIIAPQPPTTVPSSWSREVQLAGDVVDPDALPVLHPALQIANQQAHQLRRLRCDRNPDPERFADQERDADGDYGVVSLGELFDFVKAYAADVRRSDAQRRAAGLVQFNVELKRAPLFPTFIGDRFDGESPAKFERALHATLTEHGMRHRTIVQSFDHRSLWAFASLDAEVRLAALQRKSEPIPKFAQLRERGASIWSPDHVLVTPETVAAAHAAKLAVVPWTVNDPERARALLKIGVDGIITDRPDIVRIVDTK